MVVGEPEVTKQLERPTRRRGDTIKMDLKQIVLEVADRIHLA
jgi:hypothetical protein